VGEVLCCRGIEVHSRHAVNPYTLICGVYAAYGLEHTSTSL